MRLSNKAQRCILWAAFWVHAIFCIHWIAIFISAGFSGWEILPIEILIIAPVQLSVMHMNDKLKVAS